MIMPDIISMASGFTDPDPDTMSITIPTTKIVFRDQTGFWIQITNKSRIGWMIERPSVVLPLVAGDC
jgi:hypothetical protein